MEGRAIKIRSKHTEVKPPQKCTHFPKQTIPSSKKSLTIVGENVEVLESHKLLVGI